VPNQEEAIASSCLILATPVHMITREIPCTRTTDVWFSASVAPPLSSILYAICFSVPGSDVRWSAAKQSSSSRFRS